MSVEVPGIAILHHVVQIPHLHLPRQLDRDAQVETNLSTHYRYSASKAVTRKWLDIYPGLPRDNKLAYLIAMYNVNYRMR